MRESSHEPCSSSTPLPLVERSLDAAQVGYRASGGTSRNVSAKASISLRVYGVCRRVVAAGSSTSPLSSRHARAGRIGRFSNPPPQLGQTFPSTSSTQEAQNVHS